MKLPNSIYDILKWITIIALPALGTLYVTLSGIWNLPYVEQVVGTITAVITFLGCLLGISTFRYNSEPTHEDVIDILEDGDEDE